MDEAQLKKLKVPQIKELLKQSDLSIVGKKDDLIQRLLDHQLPPASSEEPKAGPTDQQLVPQNLDPDPVQPVSVPSLEINPPSPPPETAPPPPPDPETAPPPPFEKAAPPPSSEETAFNLDQPAPPPPAEDSAPAPPPVEENGSIPHNANQNQSDQDHEMLPPSKRVKYADDCSEQAPQVADLSDEDDDESFELLGQTGSGGSDLYLDTVNRDMLDFDFERLCSVTLSNINIYACLVCGKYFQGRSRISPAYAHSIGEDHHVFINLLSEKVYVLPDGYEVSDPSLDDIKYLLNPTFTPELLRRLDGGGQGPSYDLHAVAYLPGFVGLNNIKANDYLNVVVHLLAHVPPVRDYFVCRSSTGVFERARAPELVQRFGMLMRKIWNPRAFKAQVSPHEFGQEVATRSGRRFTLTSQADPIEFLGWLLNALHRDLGGSSRRGVERNTSIIHAAFRGVVRVEEEEIVTVPDSGEVGKRPQFDINQDGRRLIQSYFLFLTLDLPPPPVFQDSVQKNIIPQVNLTTLLMKYDGETRVERSGILRTHSCERLPPFIILHFKRFDSNTFIEEKNPTIVNFPTKGVDFGSCLGKNKDRAAEGQIYDLLGNVTYSSTAGTAKEDSQWKVQVHTRPAPDATGEAQETKKEDEKWFQIQDLIVEEVNRQMVFLGESYIQIWERRGGPRELKVDDENLMTVNKKKTTKNPIPG